MSGKAVITTENARRTNTEPYGCAKQTKSNVPLIDTVGPVSQALVSELNVKMTLQAFRDGHPKWRCAPCKVPPGDRLTAHVVRIGSAVSLVEPDCRGVADERD